MAGEDLQPLVVIEQLPASVTFEMKLFKLPSPSSPLSHQSVAADDGDIYRSVHLSLRLPTGLLPCKSLRQMGDCPPLQSFPEK